MTTTAEHRQPPKWLDVPGRGLMALASVGAIGAFVSGVSFVTHASAATRWVETWRMFGFLAFAGMFALMALRPRRSPGIWEIAFLHKLAMVISAHFIAETPESVLASRVDLALVAAIAVAYGLTQAWRGWSVK